MSNEQSEAQRLAAWLKEGAWHKLRLGDVEAAGRELLRLDARVKELECVLGLYSLALSEWQNKTDWIKTSLKPCELGLHLADVMRKRVEQAAASKGEP